VPTADRRRHHTDEEFGGEESAPDDVGDEDVGDEDVGDSEPAPTTLRRTSRGAQMIGAAMIGLAEVLEPKPKVEIPVEIAAPGEPPNIDLDGLDEPWGEQGERMVAPPLDQIKAKSRAGRTRKRRR
jgi:hypothetical protein